MATRRRRTTTPAQPAHDTPTLGPRDRKKPGGGTKVRPMRGKPDPAGRYDPGVPDPESERKSPWIDEGRPETNG